MCREQASAHTNAKLQIISRLSNRFGMRVVGFTAEVTTGVTDVLLIRRAAASKSEGRQKLHQRWIIFPSCQNGRRIAELIFDSVTMRSLSVFLP